MLAKPAVVQKQQQPSERPRANVGVCGAVDIEHYHQLHFNVLRTRILEVLLQRYEPLMNKTQVK